MADADGISLTEAGIDSCHGPLVCDVLGEATVTGNISLVSVHGDQEHFQKWYLARSNQGQLKMLYNRERVFPSGHAYK